MQMRHLKQGDVNGAGRVISWPAVHQSTAVSLERNESPSAAAIQTSFSPSRHVHTASFGAPPQARCRGHEMGVPCTQGLWSNLLTTQTNQTILFYAPERLEH